MNNDEKIEALMKMKEADKKYIEILEMYIASGKIMEEARDKRLLQLFSKGKKKHG